MAIFHLNTKIIGRATGRSIVQMAAYCRGAELYDEQEERAYTREQDKSEVLYSELAIPADAPSWVHEYADLETDEKHSGAECFWNDLQTFELNKRRDAQFARHMDVALPIELSLAQYVPLIREYVERNFTSHGMVADWAIHDDPGNPHLHILLSMRALTPQGFGNKVRAWNARSLLTQWRANWADVVNTHLAQHGHAVRIDHRSYKDQGITLKPTIHRGKAVSDMTLRGIATTLQAEYRARQQANQDLIMQTPQLVFDVLSRQRDSFNIEDVEKTVTRYFDPETPERNAALLKRVLDAVEMREAVFNDRDLIYAVTQVVDDPEESAQLLLQLKGSSQLIALGPGEDGRERYTTRYLFGQENRLQLLADELAAARHLRLSSKRITGALHAYGKQEGLELTTEQQTFVTHLVRAGRLACGVGIAGTGKSVALGAARSVWEERGYRVLGVALAGVAAEGLEHSSGISSVTLASFEASIKAGMLTLTAKDVIVLDEAGMIDTPTFVRLAQHVANAGAKLVAIGDSAQLQPIGPGAAFRALVERLPHVAVLSLIYRQTGWQAQATGHFARGDVATALHAYDQHQHIHFAEDAPTAIRLLVEQWQTKRQTVETLSEVVVLAHRREEVAALNQAIRAARIQAGELHERVMVPMIEGTGEVSIGERLLFLDNNRRLGVKNGQFATLTTLERDSAGHVVALGVQIDKKSQRTLFIPLKQYRSFTYGYAATVHKTQGLTVGHTLLYIASHSWNKALTYVGMSRHRLSCEVIVDKTVYTDINALSTGLGRLAIKDSVLDFPYAFALRRGILISEAILRRWQGKWAEKLAHMAETLLDRYQKLQGEAAVSLDPKLVEIRTRREEARLIARYADMNQAVGKAWSVVQAQAKTVGLSALDTRHPEWKCMETSQAYALFTEALKARDHLAFDIMQDVSRYSTAFTYYSTITIETLAKQAAVHQRREITHAYQEASKAGSVVLRDRWASHIMMDPKAYAPMIQAAKIDWALLRQHANAHQERRWLIEHTPDERAAYRDVRDYLALARRVAQERKQIEEITKAGRQVSEVQLNRFQQTQWDRDARAGRFLEERARHEMLFDHFEIGTVKIAKTDPHYQTAMKQAQTRWYRLQQYTHAHHIRTRIKAYQEAICQEDKSTAQELALEVLRDIKGHHGAILTLSSDAGETWRTLRRDARQGEIEAAVAWLLPEQQAGFRRVEAYVDARFAVSRAWREWFALLQKEESIDQQLMPVIRTLENTKQALAIAIQMDEGSHQAGMHYFGVDLEELDKTLYQAACQQRVMAYAKGDQAEKPVLAAVITTDPKGHAPYVREYQLVWKSLYQQAQHRERQLFFATLAPEAKKLMRTCDHYRHLNRRAGKYWAAIFQHKEKGHVIPPHLENRAIRASAYADAIAYRLHTDLTVLSVFARLENTEGEIASAIAWIQTQGKLNQEKLATQSERFEKRCQSMRGLNTQAEETFTRLSELFAQTSETLQPLPNEEATLAWIEGYTEIRALYEPLRRALYPVIKTPARYEAALKAEGHTVQAFVEKYEILEKWYRKCEQWQQSYFTQHTREEKWDAERKAKVARAQQMVAHSQPIEGTLAERYLREHRGISGKFSADVRYHPGLYHFEARQYLPALLAVGRNTEGQVQVVQAIYLDPKTATKARVEHAKLTYGVMSHGEWGVCIQQGCHPKRVIVAEGPETAMSVAMAARDTTVYAMLGCSQLSRVPLSKSITEVVVAADHDRDTSGTARHYQKAHKLLAARGVHVLHTQPSTEKTDFNDVLMKEGVKAVHAYLQKAAVVEIPRDLATLQQESQTVVRQLEKVIHTAEKKAQKGSSVYSSASSITLTPLIQEYVAKQMAETQLFMQLKRRSEFTSEEQFQKDTERYQKLRESTKTFIQYASTLPIVKEAFAALKHSHSQASVAKQGGYAQIQARLLENTFTQDDHVAVLRDLRQKTNQQSRTISRSHENDGYAR